MRINKLINSLKEISEKHGNVEVYFKQEQEYFGDRDSVITEIHSDIDVDKVEMETISFHNVILKGG